jgi:HEPN domain-containing protein
MADPAIISEWLNKASEDLRFAEANLNDGSEFYSRLCFHFQQAAEKYLKAFIIAKELPFIKVHDLVNLLKVCTAHDPTLAILRDECIELNAAYIETRYPVHWPTDYTRDTAERSLAAVKSIAKSVCSRLLHDT